MSIINLIQVYGIIIYILKIIVKILLKFLFMSINNFFKLLICYAIILL